ncbi:MAG: RT0821/Lpp0805 family surface protein [Magnetococcus sp. YQC-5]
MMKYLLIFFAVTGWLMNPTKGHADPGVGASIGALSGAMVGSLSGPPKNRGENSLIGAAVGGLLGYALSSESEREGHLVVNRTLEVAPSYTTATWVNPETNVSYVVVPQPAQMVEGRICREVTIRATIDAKQENLAGLTCRDENGQWRLVDRHAPTVAPVVRMAPATQTVIVSRPVTRYVVTESVPTYYYPSVSSNIIFYSGRGSRHHHHRHSGWGHGRRF